MMSPYHPRVCRATRRCPGRRRFGSAREAAANGRCGHGGDRAMFRCEPWLKKFQMLPILGTDPTKHFQDDKPKLSIELSIRFGKN